MTDANEQSPPRTPHHPPPSDAGGGGPVDDKDWDEELARARSLPARLPPPAGDYLTPAGIFLECDSIGRRHGGAAVRIGRSLEGRSLWSFRFGPDRPGGVMLVSLLHAFEWIGALTLLCLLERITVSEAALPIVAIPIANPDGAARAEGSWNIPFSRIHRGNARGVDLNRNFPAFHRPRQRWATLPWHRPGPAAASEPETRAIAAEAMARRPMLSLSFHSFGRWFFYPPAHRRRPWEATRTHREHIENAGGVRSIGYRCGQLGRWSPLFRAHGTEMDFLTHEVGSLSYLVEVSKGGLGRWGLRGLAIPFRAFNPPRPLEEAERVAAFCRELIRTVTA